MKKIFKQVLAVVLAVAMILTLVNVPAIGSEAASKKKSVKSVTVTNLPAKTLTLKKNKTFQLKTKVTVTGKASKAVIYKSSKPKVATVNSKGKIKAKKNGKTVITITSKADKSKKYKITVTVGTPATKVSIKASKNYVATGKTLQLKAMVTPKKASNKKVVWSSSNKKVATVTSKGVVKGIKSGTATITAKAADGSGKKAKFKVNVVAPIQISSVNFENTQTIKVVLAEAQKLKTPTFSVQYKKLLNGKYYKSSVISGIQTTDNKTYTLKLKNAEEIEENDIVRVTAVGLVGSSIKEAAYSSGIFTYNEERKYKVTLNEEFYNYLYAPGYGYHTYTVKNLPGGIKYTTTDSGDLKFYGTPTQAGLYNSLVTCRDELGNIYNYTVLFIIGSDSTIAAADATEYDITEGEDGCKVSYYYSYGSNIMGGSGSYKFAFASSGYGLYIDQSSGRIWGTLTAGTYKIKLKITDANNSSLQATPTVTIKIAKGYCVSGTIKDLNNNPIKGAYIDFYNKDKTDKYGGIPSNCYASSTSNNTKGTYVDYIPAGTYDVKITKNGESIWLYNQKITGDKLEWDITMPVYKVMLVSSAPEYNIEIDDWYDENDEIVGDGGNALYLRAGTHHIYGNGAGLLNSYKVTIDGTVDKNTKYLTPVYTKVSSTVKGSITLNKEVEFKLAGGTRYTVYSFKPSSTGTYYFTSSGSYSTYGKLFDGYSNILAEDYGSSLEMSYKCTAGTTYYIGVRAYSTSYAGKSCTLKVSTTAP